MLHREEFTVCSDIKKQTHYRQNAGFWNVKTGVL
jgi:hypothetical protein